MPTINIDEMVANDVWLGSLHTLRILDMTFPGLGGRPSTCPRAICACLHIHHFHTAIQIYGTLCSMNKSDHHNHSPSWTVITFTTATATGQSYKSY